MKLSPEAVLKSAMENGMLDVAQVKARYDMKKRKGMLEQHNLKIWQGTDGKWRSFQDHMAGDNTVAKYIRIIEDILKTQNLPNRISKPLI